MQTTSGKISRAFNRKAYLTRYGVLQGKVWKGRWACAPLPPLPCVDFVGSLE